MFQSCPVQDCFWRHRLKATFALFKSMFISNIIVLITHSIISNFVFSLKPAGKNITTTYFQTRQQHNPISNSWLWPRCGKNNKRLTVIMKMTAMNNQKTTVMEMNLWTALKIESLITTCHCDKIFIRGSHKLVTRQQDCSLVHLNEDNTFCIIHMIVFSVWTSLKLCHLVT